MNSGYIWDTTRLKKDDLYRPRKKTIATYKKSRLPSELFQTRAATAFLMRGPLRARGRAKRRRANRHQHILLSPLSIYWY